MQMQACLRGDPGADPGHLSCVLQRNPERQGEPWATVES